MWLPKEKVFEELQVAAWRTVELHGSHLVLHSVTKVSAFGAVALDSTPTFRVWDFVSALTIA